MNQSKKVKIIPHNHDVLFGRGNRNARHYGNERLRALARRRIVNYRNASKKEKAIVSQSIVSQIQHNQNPSGRFLKKDCVTLEWLEVTDEMAREKTSQALRDAVSSGVVKIYKHGLRPRMTDARKNLNAAPYFKELLLSPVKQNPIQENKRVMCSNDYPTSNNTDRSTFCNSDNIRFSITMPPVCISPIKLQSLPKVIDNAHNITTNNGNPSSSSSCTKDFVSSFFDLDSEEYDEDSMNYFVDLFGGGLLQGSTIPSDNKQKKQTTNENINKSSSMFVQNPYPSNSNSIVCSENFNNNYTPYCYNSNRQVGSKWKMFD